MMTNDELKKKILEIFEKAIGDWYEKDDGLFAEGYTPEEGDNRLKAFMADALIAAGLRFGENLTATFDRMALEREHELERRLGEAEHRAARAERALHCLARSFAKALCKNGNAENLIHGFIQDAQKQAEEELKGESKK